MPLISSPPLTCVFFPSLSPLALSAAGKAGQSVAGILQTGDPFQPEPAGQVPEGLPGQHSENISGAGR